MSIPEDIAVTLSGLHNKSILPPHDCLTGCNACYLGERISELTADYARLKAAAEQMRQTLDDLFVYEMPSKMEGPTAVRWNQIEAALAAYQEATR